MWPDEISLKAIGGMRAICVEWALGVQTMKREEESGHICSLMLLPQFCAAKQNMKEKLTNILSLLMHRSKHIDGVLQL